MSKNKKAWIFGGGGHSRVIHSFIRDLYEEIAFILPETETALIANFKDYKDHHFYIGIGDNGKREALFMKLKALGAQMPLCKGPLSTIDDTVKYGEAVFVGAGAHILVNSVIGDNVIINTGSSIDHDCVVEDHSQITAGVRLAGGTKIGKRCFLGMGVITIPGVNVANNVQAMAGSVIVKDIEESFMVGGYPAKVIKKQVSE